MMYSFFFKQKTANEMRISDWSSDVCSSDLPDREPVDRRNDRHLARLEGARDTLDTTPIIDPRRRWRVAWPNASTILHRLDVATGGKGAAGACQYGDTDRIIRFHILDRRNQVVAILDAADRVQPCRAVECQDGDAIPPFDPHKISHRPNSFNARSQVRRAGPATARDSHRGP